MEKQSEENSSKSSDDVVSLLLQRLGKIYNESGSESRMMKCIKEWMQENQLVNDDDDGYTKVESDESWGMHYFRCFKVGCSTSSVLPLKRGVLLAAHLDSDHLPGSEEELDRISFDYNKTERCLYYDKNVEIGLDDKTGITVILNTLLKLKQMEDQIKPGASLKKISNTRVIPVHVVFTVQEEVGQKGMINLPLAKLQHIYSSVQFGIIVDRMSSRHNGLRHIVTQYCGVPLIVPAQAETLLHLFEQALGGRGGGSPIATTASAFCSDALEWRGRIDAEILAKNKLPALYEQYQKITLEIKEQMKLVPAATAVCGFSKEPRTTRYAVMRKIFHQLYKDKQKRTKGEAGAGGGGGGKEGEDLEFSVVNLSLDYDEDSNCISIQELDDTTEILIKFVQSMVISDL